MIVGSILRDRRALVGVVLLVVGLLGCNTGSDKPLVLVSGRVTYGGGEWPMTGTITFTPLESLGPTPARPGGARFGPDGKFVVGSYKPGDGLMPGRYVITVSCFDPDLQIPQAEAEYVPKDFDADELIIKQGQEAVELNFDVPKKIGETRA
jgi:hypothetical protein